MRSERRYFVYLMASKRNGTLYAGVTNYLAARSAQHKAGEDAIKDWQLIGPFCSPKSGEITALCVLIEPKSTPNLTCGGSGTVTTRGKKIAVVVVMPGCGMVASALTDGWVGVSAMSSSPSNINSSSHQKGRADAERFNLSSSLS